MITAKGNKEFEREANFQADCLHRAQAACLKDRARYLATIAKYGAREDELFRLPLEKLRELVEELET